MTGGLCVCPVRRCLSALVIPLCLLALYPIFCLGSPPLSSSPLVRDFPLSGRRSGCLGFPKPQSFHRIKCVFDRRKRRVLCPMELLNLCFPVVGVFSFTLLPGFIGPESSVLPADLPRSVPFPFRVRLSWIGFMEHEAISCSRTGALPGVRHATSSYPVQLQRASIYGRISGLALPRLLGPLRTPI